MKYIVVLFIAILSTNVTAGETLHWWQFWTDPAIKPTINSIVDEFEKANPDITVELTDLTWANGHEKIVLALASGTGPDVLELGSDWIAQFAANDHLADISKIVKDDSSEYQGWGMSTYKNNVYGFPWILGTRILFANRELLNRAGYDPDFLPVTWDDLIKAATAISALDNDIYGWGSNAAEKHRLYKKFLPFFWSAGAQIFSDDGRHCVLSSTFAVDALTAYKKLHDSCGYVANQRGIEDAFLDGKIGFIISGDWLLKRIELENRNIDLVSTLIPGPTFIGRSFMGGEFLSINKTSKQKKAAMKLIRFVASPENQVRFCKANHSANPSSIKAQKNEYFSSNVHLQTFIKQISMSDYPPVDPDWVYIEEIIEGAVEDALFGSGLIAEPLRLARDKIAKLKSK
ncbi:MAG: extracellular solute-binding protein [candidate division Zixibacteria bacterium]|nr:extracellular solute-binding protein [candidate division Zixibacteria bacterium]